MEHSSLLGDGARRQGGGYTGDVGAAHAWERLRSDPDAALVDVRTHAEWNFVGVPDLSELGKEVVFVEWQSYPAMEANPAFVDAVSAAAPDRRAPLYLLCRSGARSRAAAIALTGAGYAECYNVSGGFEGPHDARKHRGVEDGWKASRLPWVQG